MEERLDRFLCIVEWPLLFPKASAVYIDSDIFDHLSILLKFYPRKTRSHGDRRLFRFEACGPWSQLVWM